MSVPMYNPTITWICLTLFLIQSGCATSPRVAALPSEDIRKSLGTIGVVSAQATPKVRFLAPTRVKGAGAAAGRTAGGALGGLWGGCGQVILGTLETIIVPILTWYGCVAVTPFVAVGGALIGGAGSDAAKANRAAKAKHKAEVKELRPIIDAALDAVATDTPLRDGLIEQARTHHAFVSVPASDSKKPDKRAHYGSLESEGIDTVLEVSVPRLDFAADYAFALTAQARLIRVRDNTVLYTGTYTFENGARGIFQWTADGGDKLSSAFASAYRGLAEKIVDDVFLLQPLPLARLEADADKQRTGDASDSKDDEKSTRESVISVSGLRPESPQLDSPVVDTLQPTLRAGRASTEPTGLLSAVTSREVPSDPSEGITLRPIGPAQAIYDTAETYCQRFRKRSSLIAAPPENSDYVFVCYR